MNFFSWLKSKPVDDKGITLYVVLGNTRLAKLYHDETAFCLEYLPGFLESKIAPFNPSDLAGKWIPEIGKVYRSPDLWNAFSSRLPSPSRDDFSNLVNILGVSEKDGLLLALAKAGKISISKPWVLELNDNSVKKRA